MHWIIKFISRFIYEQSCFSLMFWLKTLSGKQELIDKTNNRNGQYYKKDNRSFQESLRDMALQCADGADIHTAWHDFLCSILKEWNADIQMDLHEAVAIMLSAAGLNEFVIYREFMDYVRYLSLCVKRSENGIDFWFKPPTELQSLPEAMLSKTKKI